MDFLQVTQSEQLDIVLPEAPVRYRGPDRRDRERLVGLVELEIEVRFVVEVGPGDEIEPAAFPCPCELREVSQLLLDYLIVDYVTGSRHVVGLCHCSPFLASSPSASGPRQAGVKLTAYVLVHRLTRGLRPP